MSRHNFNDAEIEALRKFVEKGGGLLIGGQAWSWRHYSGLWSDHVQFANGFPGNK